MTKLPNDAFLRVYPIIKQHMTVVVEKPVRLGGIFEKYNVSKNFPKTCSIRYHQKGFGGDNSVGTGFLPQAFSETIRMNFQ